VSRLKNFRQTETLAELGRLRTELSSWLKRKKYADARGQYTTQLAVLERELCDAIEALSQWVARDFSAANTGEVFRQLAMDDRRIIWIRDAWNFYRQKFDQREVEELKTVLSAADEVLWSCYKPFFGGRAIPPAPLCCIDSSYVPGSIRPDQARHQLGRTTETDTGVLAPFFQTLPIPILRLPPSVASSPWLLALIGHETGHFLLRLLPRALDLLKEQIEKAVGQCCGSDDDKAAWRNCAEEIFCDFYFALAVGPWAVWALAPWTLGPDAAMLTRDRYYPAPLARLRLIAVAAEALGLAGAEALRASSSGRLGPAAFPTRPSWTYASPSRSGGSLPSPCRTERAACSTASSSVRAISRRTESWTGGRPRCRGTRSVRTTTTCARPGLCAPRR